jgi:hypothetical protein
VGSFYDFTLWEWDGATVPREDCSQLIVTHSTEIGRGLGSAGVIDDGNIRTLDRMVEWRRSFCITLKSVPTLLKSVE